MLTRDKTPFDTDFDAAHPPLQERWTMIVQNVRMRFRRHAPVAAAPRPEPAPSLEPVALPAAIPSASSWAPFLAMLSGLLRDPLYVRLPFEERRFGLMLAALLSITLYGSFLAIGVSGVLGHAASGMDREMARRITFEVLPDPGKPGDVESKQERVKALAEKLSEVEGVEKVTHLPEEKMNALLAPWLGREKAPTDLPLPALIDVELKEPSPQIKEALAKAAAGVQGVMMDDHVAFEGALFRSVRGLQFTALYVLALGFAALLLTAAFAAETHFHINRNTIEILHLIGARDSAIARHMGLAVLRLAVAAAISAFTLALLTLFVLSGSMQGLDLSLFPNFSLGLGGLVGIVMKWIMAAILAITLCYAAAHISVLRALSRMI
jgi:cell division transport system permease protein